MSATVTCGPYATTSARAGSDASAATAATTKSRAGFRMPSGSTPRRGTLLEGGPVDERAVYPGENEVPHQGRVPDGDCEPDQRARRAQAREQAANHAAAGLVWSAHTIRRCR